jgi:hypothetical protein
MLLMLADADADHALKLCGPGLPGLWQQRCQELDYGVCPLSIQPSDGASGLPIQAVDEELGLVASFSRISWVQVDSVRLFPVHM